MGLLRQLRRLLLVDLWRLYYRCCRFGLFDRLFLFGLFGRWGLYYQFGRFDQWGLYYLFGLCCQWSLVDLYYLFGLLNLLNPLIR